MTFEDNIIGKWSFNPPYRFIVGNTVLWDSTQDTVVNIVDDPATAYMIYSELKERDKLTPREYLYQWYLKDSFNRDAVEFCKKAAENPIVDVAKEGEVEVEK